MIGKETEVAYLKNAGLSHVAVAEFYNVDVASLSNFVKLHIKNKHELLDAKTNDDKLFFAIQGYLNAPSDEIKEVISKKVLSKHLDELISETNYLLQTREGHNGLFRAIIQDEPYQFDFSNEQMLNTLIGYVVSTLVAQEKGVSKKVIRDVASLAANKAVKNKYGSAVKDYVNELLTGVNLTERERGVLESRYGLKDKKKTQLEVASELDLHKGRIGQIEAKVLRKLFYHKSTNHDLFLKYFSNFVFDIDLEKVEAKNRPFNYEEEENQHGKPRFEKKFDLLTQTLGVLIPENEKNPEALKPLLEELIEFSPRGKELSKEQKIMLELVYSKNLNYKEAQDVLVFGHSFNLNKVFNSALDWILTTENLAHFYYTKLNSIPKENEMYNIYRKAYVTAYEEFKSYAVGVLEEIANMKSNVNKNIKNLDLSVRATRCLQSLGINTLKELSQMTETELRHSRNLGEKTFEELKDVLKKNGLSLK